MSDSNSSQSNISENLVFSHPEKPKDGKRLRIAILHHLSVGGGAKRVLFEMARRLSERGHCMDVYHLNDCDDVYLSLRPLTQFSYSYFFEHKYFEPLRYFLRRHFRDIYRPINLLEKINNIRRFNGACRNIAEDIDGRGYDLVFVNPFAYFNSPNVLRYLKTPSIFLCHEPIRHATEFLPRKRQPIHWLKRQIGKFRRIKQLEMLYLKRNDVQNIQCASRVLVNSYYSRENLYRWYSIDASVLRFGVDTELFRWLDLARENFVFSVGTLAPHKAHEFIIESLSHIPAYRRPSLVVAGIHGRKREDEYLKKCALENNVELSIEKEISDQKLVELYNRAKLTTCGALMEPFGLTPLESFACQTPVVAVAEAGFRETVIDGYTGLLAPREPKKFADAISFLLENEEIRISMGKQGREEVVKRWQWKIAIDQLEELFNDTLEGN